jgi:hypothetical protein
MRNLIWSVVIGLVFVTGARAQSPAPSAGHRRAAEDLIAVMDMEQVFNQGVEMMMQAQINADPMLKQFEDIVRAFMGKYLKWSDLEADYAKIYMDVFSEDELRQMVELYQTPLGKKMLKTLPDLLARGAQLSNDRLQPHLPELQQQIFERLEQQRKEKRPEKAPQADQPATQLQAL